ncbi:MAG: cytidyltransferase [Firmicutes bacterium]|nr:cytidyltransferase [Bacillota bacterium]
MVNNTIAFSLYNKINNKLLNSDFARENHDNYELIKTTLEKPSFLDNLKNMVNEKNYSSKAVLNLSEDILKSITRGKEPKDWLNYIYQYVLSKSFPNSIEIKLNKTHNEAAKLYLKIFRLILEHEKMSDKDLFNLKYPIEFLKPNEEKDLPSFTEYRRFKKIYKNNYIYEMMKLHQELTGHNTLDHISGVHYIALHVARQLEKIGLPVDLGRVSGAAAGHDIGKYGCKGPELKRVPYLHYYYTDIWFKNNNIPYIGHIAMNHSTWDLELENLPLESLILIYSDFRVKNKITADNEKKMTIFTLKESFEIVLNKLDNVNETKEKRYKRVYSKLRDFEDYLLNLGVNVDLTTKKLSKRPKNYYSLMQGEDIINNLKFLSINHNIHLMNELRSESSLSSILELARSENDWKKLRGYLQVFEEYSTYLTQKQKLITLKFLYELLIHKEEDIRKQSAELIGELISTFDEEYRKEVPEDDTLEPPETTSYKLLDKYINLFLYPDHKIIDVHREWIGYSLRIMVSSLFSKAPSKQKNEFRHILLKYYDTAFNEDKNIHFYLLQSIKYIPCFNAEDKSSFKLYTFIFKALENDDLEIRLAALDRVYNILFRVDEDSYFSNELKNYLKRHAKSSNVAAENFLKLKIAKKIQIDKNILDKYINFYNEDNKQISDIFLKNLKSATNWVNKKVHVELLLEQVIDNPEKQGLHTAMHFCNLIKVSAIENVRNHAGDALLKIFPFLSLDQRNDVTVELLRALEIQGYHFTKYIPKYLGQLMLYLQPGELDELIDDFIEKIKKANTQIVFLLLKTLGVCIANYPKYKDLFTESEKINRQRLVKMLGILLNAMASYNTQVKQEALRVIGKDIFAASELKIQQKKDIFNLIAKKILTLLSDIEKNELLFLSNSAALNHIYRYISDYTFFEGEIDISTDRKIAFFPGTFDPFSLSHKEIAKEIRDLGFEVYLAVDEFSWSKRTQPHKLRREIISMSIANELNIYLYPEDLQINIANPKKLAVLKESFKDSNIHIVVGSDVILNASSYRKEIEANSVHNFSHIVFDRRSNNKNSKDDKKLKEALENIKGDIIRLSLPPQYEDISSTQIRNYIDENRDITELIDPMAQSYIYKQGIYRREPQYKTLLQTKSLDVEVIDDIKEPLLKDLCEQFFENSQKAYNQLLDIKYKLNPRVIIVRDIENQGHIVGFSTFHWVRSSMLFGQFNNNNISEYIRENAVGRIITIDGIFIDNNTRFENLEQILLTETLALCLAKDYTYAIFKNVIEDYYSYNLYETLKLQGFTKLPYGSNYNPVYVVSMTNPCTLNLDLESLIKEPFISNLKVRKAIQRSRRKLQKALTDLYPGQLVLSFDRDMVYDNMIEKICKINNMPVAQLKPRKLGSNMCVPFGSILKGHTVPNTVTKSMHTEKMFTPDLKSFDIGPFPYYMNLENQIKMIKSFNRPVILIDDLLNKGYRIKAIDPLLKQENVDVKKIIVGILSGRGKELMDIQNREVDCAYFIPNLKVWFNENSLYPFIGGDSVWRGSFPRRNLLPSINLILPYASPTFIKRTSNKALYNLSKICIDNSVDILRTLEREYQNMHERNLTLRHLGEVILSPRCPDHGENIDYDINLKPSEYIKNDLEHLKRMEDIIKRARS